MSFAELVTEDRRLALLCLLVEAPGMSANTQVLATGLRTMGHNCSADQVETDAAWLAENGLSKVESVGKMRVVIITQRGVDVAAGRAKVPGVVQPLPGA